MCRIDGHDAEKHQARGRRGKTMVKKREEKEERKKKKQQMPANKQCPRGGKLVLGLC